MMIQAPHIFIIVIIRLLLLLRDYESLQKQQRKSIGWGKGKVTAKAAVLTKKIPNTHSKVKLFFRGRKSSYLESCPRPDVGRRIAAVLTGASDGDGGKQRACCELLSNLHAAPKCNKPRAVF